MRDTALSSLKSLPAEDVQRCLRHILGRYIPPSVRQMLEVSPSQVKP